MGDGPGPFDQMRELRVRASMRAQRERALLLEVARCSGDLANALIHAAVVEPADEAANREQIARTVEALATLRQALADYETWRVANP